MNSDELGNSVHSSSMRAYRAILKQPQPRWPFVFGGLLLASVVVYVVTLSHSAWLAYMCKESGDTYTRSGCEPRAEPIPPAQHFTLELPPILPDAPEGPRKPPPAPIGPGI